MAFTHFPDEQEVVQLLQRSLERGRLGHGYLFAGNDLTKLEAVARTLAKTLNCEQPPLQSAGGMPKDCCDACATCQKVEHETHPDVYWVRPESKSRVITIDQVRELMQTVQLKPTQAAWKVGVIVAADRLNPQAANAFLKTLEEPPSNSVLVLLTTQPDRLLETILSRCLRLNFAGEGKQFADPAFLAWLSRFVEMASVEQRSLLGRYRLLSVLLSRLNEVKASINEVLKKRSPLERFDDIDPKLREKWEEELEAAIEAEYRRQRTDLLAGLQWWLRDVWLETLNLGRELGAFPQLSQATVKVAQRLSVEQAQENLRLVERLQRLLNTNVQEALALEVGLLELKL